MADSSSEDELPLSSLKKKNTVSEEDDTPLSVLKNKSEPAESTMHISVLEIPACLETVDLNEHRVIVTDSEQCQSKHCMCEVEVDSDLLSDASSDCDYDSNKDPEFRPGACEVRKCKVEVWAACTECEMMLCFDHFNEDVVSCSNHGKSTRKPKRKRKHAFDKGMAVSDTKQVVRGSDKGEKSFPEDYTVEGVEKEGVQRKKARVNTRKEEKKKKDFGQEYTSTKTKKTMPAKCVKPRCKDGQDSTAKITPTGTLERTNEEADIERDQLIRQRYQITLIDTQEWSRIIAEQAQQGNTLALN
ncbi:hypothetical protein ElyMa_006556700 [Elysia marginata]|uniref:AN1-type domain-containing protein n=1 Tax=Elysia marginata TaxID=1093978 RepID=A0AAV4I9B1_9GAST|nr:hypothetical protein ElyMa_006556700 [Elysia marginata]